MNRVALVGLAGRWLAIGGVLLFVGSIATGPTMGCTLAGGDDGGVNTCTMDVTYVLAFVGLGSAALGALLWGGVFVREKIDGRTA